MKAKEREVLIAFAKRLKILRLENGWTQEELAKRMDCPYSLISYYENAQREPGFTNILALSELFDEPVDYIMGISNERRVKKISS